uniref:Uncharacterized protein n=1 Tax=Bracon brevicornis TaxID=1563983 RepID=A0A6V7KND8_9HYME
MWPYIPGDIETIQTNFFKRLYCLPLCTPGYALRVELSRLPLHFKVFKQAWAWVLKILSMQDNRLPKTCFLRLHGLSMKEGVN